MAHKFTDIKNDWLNGEKVTFYTIWYLIDGSWIKSGCDYVSGWFKTSRGISNQIKREGGEV
ncbi:MAG: hypothetical protein QXT77_08705 [Candidatus Methanomethylicaceae archaeon]